MTSQKDSKIIKKGILWITIATFIFVIIMFLFPENYFDEPKGRILFSFIGLMSYFATAYLVRLFMNEK